MEASTTVQLPISVSTSPRMRRISSPMFSTLKSEMPRWLRRSSASASFCAVGDPPRVRHLEDVGVDGVRAREVLLERW